MSKILINFQILFDILIIFSVHFFHSLQIESERKIIRLPGDIILGAIFPMHEQISGSNPEFPCGAVKEEKGVQRLEAMLMAIDEINAHPNLLPNVTLGAVIIDSCSSDTYALEQSMEFVRSYMNQDISEYKCESGEVPIYIPFKPVTSVVGASFSGVSIMVANILRLFKIPQISYASTSTELSDKSRFDYFSRVVPPDNYQAQAIVEIVKQLNWTYVSTVAVEGDYGEKGIASFSQISSQFGICIAISEKILRNSKPEDYDRIIQKLSTKPQAKAVILFVDEDNTRKLLQACIKANKTRQFFWIGSDSWGAKVHPVRDQELAAEGAITILPHRTAIKEFDDYFQSLKPKTNPNMCKTKNAINISYNESIIINCRNIWFQEFWSQHHKCSFNDSVNATTKKCTGLESLKNYEQEGLVPYVFDAVYATAMAINNLINDVCGLISYQLCDALKKESVGPELLKHIRKLSFKGRQGMEIKFNKDGDAYGSYNIYQYQYLGDKYDYVQIGEWKEKLVLKIEKMRWDNNTNQIPKSVCSNFCQHGYIRNFQEQCCWTCVPCRDDAYVFNDTCKPCNPGYAPDTNRSTCLKLKPLILDWLNPWALVPIVTSVIGISLTIFTFCVFIFYNRTPVIMASGRELCYVLLCGIFLCYSMSFVILAHPNTTNCAIMRVGLGLCLSICYSAIFTKTNRISRIFNRGVKSIQRPLYTSPVSQITISLGIVAIQFFGAIIWLLIEKPDIREIYPYPLTAVLTCRVSNFSLMMSLIYNMILITLCTWYAFKTRKIPENFNEAKYIGFTMYSTCIVWLAFLPIYFGTNNDYTMQIVSMSMCLNISATVALSCLFAPKVYLVIFQPYKNIRPGNQASQRHLGSGSDQTSRGPKMRFVKTRSNTMLSMTTSSKDGSKAINSEKFYKSNLSDQTEQYQSS